jgi:outer membrane receptor protein involved in Fe transport
MRSFSIFFIFLLNPFLVWGQNSILGKLLDNEQKPIELANVLLFSANDTLKLIQATTSDSLGNFQLQNLEKGTFRLKFHLLGYQNKSLKLEKLNEQNLNLGIIRLETDSKILNSVEVVSQKEFFQKTPQGLIISAESTLSQAGGTVIDLLRNTPTVFVDAEGNINLRGKTPLILINGRNSSLSNLANIPASSIESIEIINNPTAQYDAEAENGIINIKLKKSLQNGTNGAFGLGAGFGARARLNSSVLLNHKVGNWNLGFAYDNRFAGRTRRATGDRINFGLPEQYFLTQNRFDNRNEQTHNLRLNLDFENKKHILNLELIGSMDDEDNFETLFSTFATQNRDFRGKNRRFSEELAQEKVAEFALNYQRKFANANRKLFFNFASSFNLGKENTQIDTQSLDSNDGIIGDIFIQKTSFSENSNVSNLRLDYAQNFGKGSLEMGYKGILRLFESDFKQENRINNEFLAIPELTGVLNFDEQIHATYLQYKSYWGDKKNPQAEYDLGVRAEQTLNQGKVLSQSLQFDNQYLNLFPTAGITFHFNQNQNVRFSYGRRINRPRLGQLNPFTDITDSLTQRSGNPTLQPELVHVLEAGYTQDFKKYSVITKIFYRNATQSILPFTVLQPNGVLFTRPENVGKTQTYGLESIFTYQPWVAWNGNLSFSLFQQNIDAGNIQTEVVNQVLSWNAKWINDFLLWKGSKLQVIGIYNSPTATIQGTRIAVYNVDLAFQQKIWQDKGRLGFIISDIFNTQQNGFTWKTSDFEFVRVFKVDTRAILLTFAYTFGTKFKEKLMENKFSND